MPESTHVRMHIKEIKMASVSNLVLANDRDDRFMAVRLAEPSARKMQLEMTGRDRPSSVVLDLLANTLKFMKGELKKVELDWEDRPGLQAAMIIEQEGKEIRLPARIVDAMLYAHRHQVPIDVTEAALARQGIRTGETGAQAANADWMEAFRLLAGFIGQGQVDDAILACRRLRELAPENQSWCVTLGELYAQKGWLVAAAGEFAKGLAWNIREGYVKAAAEIGNQMAALNFDTLPRVSLRAPALIEDFATPELNIEWWGAGTVIDAPGGASGKAYLIAPDRTWCNLVLNGTHIWEGAKLVRLDVFVGPHPNAAVPPLRLGLTLVGAQEGSATTWDAAPLKPGQNSLVFTLADLFLKETGQDEYKRGRLTGSSIGPVTNIQFLFDRPAGDMAFANIRLE